MKRFIRDIFQIVSCVGILMASLCVIMCILSAIIGHFNPTVGAIVLASLGQDVCLTFVEGVIIILTAECIIKKI